MSEEWTPVKKGKSSFCDECRKSSFRCDVCKYFLDKFGTRKVFLLCTQCDNCYMFKNNSLIPVTVKKQILDKNYKVGLCRSCDPKNTLKDNADVTRLTPFIRDLLYSKS